MCHVHGFDPYLYIEAPHGFNHDHLLPFKSIKLVHQTSGLLRLKATAIDIVCRDEGKNNIYVLHKQHLAEIFKFLFF